MVTEEALLGSSSSFQGRMHNIVGSIQSEVNCLLTV